ncbi:hypothetical protein GQ53DRAFT_765919 [Thozetella sp. PMI_491]|nr:hypothetical protein GQ53DRAFT_765919 [Thozetella sp. PMI_491]
MAALRDCISFSLSVPTACSRMRRLGITVTRQPSRPRGLAGLRFVATADKVASKDPTLCYPTPHAALLRQFRPVENTKESSAAQVGEWTEMSPPPPPPGSRAPVVRSCGRDHY